VKPLHWIFLTLSLVFATTLSAANIDPLFKEQLLAAKPTEQFSIIARLNNPHNIQKLDQDLHARRAPLAERHLQVIEALKANAAETQGPIVQRLDAMKKLGLVRGYHAYWIENIFVVSGTAEAVLTLATDPAIESIGSNFKAELIEPVRRGPIRNENPRRLDNETTTPGQNATGATRINRELGFTGVGTLIGGCDTGVAGQHPALASRWRGTVAPHNQCWLNLISSGDTPTDNNSHGTHTMGTMTGREIRQNGDTITVGAAPDAMWIATNPIDQGVTPEFLNDIITAYEWFIDPDGDPNTMEDVPDVIQNSWGVTTGHVQTHCYNNWNTVITNCEAAGPVITWSAGNEGPSGTSLRSPATYELTPTQIFSVGAVDATNDLVPPYAIADFSSRGPSGCDPSPNAIKPEISAPGVDVYSTTPPNSYQGSGWSGTSMAGPHVAGIVALMRQACPNCDPQTIKEAIMTTAIDVGYGQPGEDNTFGAGFINGYDAVLLVASLGRVAGTITTSAGTPLSGVKVQATGLAGSALSDVNGHYVMAAQEGTYNFRFTKFGYGTALVNDVQIVEGDTTVHDVTMNTIPTGRLLGTVVLQSGVPVQNAKVKIQDTPLDTMTTNSNGNFLVELPATVYSVHVQFTINIEPPYFVEMDTLLTVTVGDTTRATIIVNVPLVDPTPADGYGYRIYDRYDRDLPAPHEWVEISSDFGAPGTPFSFSDGDSSVYLPTPFPIKFYGQTEDTMTVNCNGWMLPGVHHQAGANNRVILYTPTNAEPPGIIAPFWANMRNTGQQFSWYDAANGRWILEFVSQRTITGGSNRYENWQVHLLDPAFYPTATGDCDIVFIYGRMDYMVNGTIGIRDFAQTRGLQVFYNGDLNANSWPIENGAALRATTGRPTGLAVVQGQVTLHPAPADMTSAILHVSGHSIHPNSAGTFTEDSIPLAPTSAMFDLTGYETWRQDGITVSPGTPTTINLEAWRLDPPRWVWAEQMNGRITLHWWLPESAASDHNPALNFYIYRDDTLVSGALNDTLYYFTDAQLPNGRTVNYTVQARYGHGYSNAAPVAITVDLAARDITSTLPTQFALYPNYPNPFNPDTRIRMDVPVRSEARVDVYDVNGRLVRTLMNGVLNAGRFELTWNGNDEAGHNVATGLYFCRMSSPTFVATQKMLLVK
jgi:hypothetical protein